MAAALSVHLVYLSGLILLLHPSKTKRKCDMNLWSKFITTQGRARRSSGDEDA